MELMAERWTEERLDDLKGQVEKLERRTDAGFRELRQEMDRRFDKVDGRFDKVGERFDKVDGRFEAIERRFDLIDGRFEAIHRTLILFLASMFAATIGLVATLIATQL
jgi:predicted nuclease with TOPRIM domain